MKRTKRAKMRFRRYLDSVLTVGSFVSFCAMSYTTAKDIKGKAAKEDIETDIIWASLFLIQTLRNAQTVWRDAGEEVALEWKEKGYDPETIEET